MGPGGLLLLAHNEAVQAWSQPYSTTGFLEALEAKEKRQRSCPGEHSSVRHVGQHAQAKACDYLVKATCDLP